MIGKRSLAPNFTDNLTKSKHQMQNQPKILIESN